MQRERHAVAHLSRLGNRREDLDAGDIDRKAFVSAAVVEQRPCLVECCGSGIDQRQHGAERRIGFAGADGCVGQIEQPRVVAVDDGDFFLIPCPKCREFHARSPLSSRKIYDIKKYISRKISINKSLREMRQSGDDR